MNAADTVFHGGTVWTAAEGPAVATGIAVRAGRIAAVGSDEEVASLIGPHTEVVDLRGRSLLPGLIDAHVHFIPGGLQLASVDLRGASTHEALVQRIGAFASTLEPGVWISGGGWDHEAWGGALPDRTWIDRVTPDNPVFVTRLDLHMALANSVALRLAGVDEHVTDPAGGTVSRDRFGRPSGVLKDEAMRLVERVMPEPSEAELDDAFDAATEHALSLGLTQVHDMGFLGAATWNHLEACRRARRDGRLRLRIYSVVPMSTAPQLVELVTKEGRGDERLWWGGVKAFVDGSLGSTTAWFHEPYEDDPTTTGLIVTDPTLLKQQILDSVAAGLQPIVHAIGDRANDWLLDVYGEAATSGATRAPGAISTGATSPRPRIEHAQHLTRSAIERFAALGVTASMQPYHAADDGRWAEKRLGAERVDTAYAFRSLLDAGASVAFGSDWTVAPLNPLLGIQAAVTRQTLDGANPDGWVPEQKIGLEEALRGYTIEAARAGHREKEVGSLEVGKAADLVVLSGDIFGTPPDQVAELSVDLTIVEGTVEYRRR